MWVYIYQQKHKTRSVIVLPTLFLLKFDQMDNGNRLYLAPSPSRSYMSLLGRSYVAPTSGEIRPVSLQIGDIPPI